jgi:hypothetical protein
MLRFSCPAFSTLNSCGVSQLSSGSTEGTTSDVGGALLEHDATDASAVSARRPKKKRGDLILSSFFSSSLC